MEQVDQQVILEKIDTIGRCIERVKVELPASSEELKSNVQAQDMVVLNLQRLVQAAVDLAAHMIGANQWQTPTQASDVFEILARQKIIAPDLARKLVGAVGFRNLAVHEYKELDYDIVYAISTKGLEDFIEFSKRVLQHLGIK